MIVDDLLGQMTLREKVGQLNQRLHGWKAYGPDGLTSEFRDEVARFGGMGALYGLFRADPWSGVDASSGVPPERCAEVAGSVQRFLKDNTRLGIPALIVEECPHGFLGLGGTVLPVNLGVGASWDPDRYEDAMRCVGRELRYRGVHAGLISGLDIARDPRWGRTEECFSEDPYLASVLTAAAVRGLRAAGVAPVLKHFAAQGSATGGHNGGSVCIGERELREIHLPAALAGIRAGAAGVMAAYNDIDGVPCVANRWLLTDLLRGEWGFDGIVMGDGGAADRLAAVTGGLVSAGAAAVGAGVDLSLWDASFGKLEQAVEQGLLSEQDINRAARRVLTLKFRLGLLDTGPGGADPGSPDSGSPDSGAGELGRQVAERSVVLLRNRNALLPLDPPPARIAVIGPNGDYLLNQLGDYPPSSVRGTTIAQGLAEALDGQVRYARGCSVTGSGDEGFAAAVRLAADSDLVVLALGGSSARTTQTAFADNGAALSSTDMNCGEGADLADIRLGGRQADLVRAVAAAGRPMVAVLVQGRPHAVAELDEHCDAIVSAWYPGQCGGEAIAAVLLGRAEPGGRLPVSVPRSSGALPVCYDVRVDDLPGHADQPDGVLYPFGFGLGYTTFALGPVALRLKSAAVAADITLSNTGTRTGTAVPQLYTRHDPAAAGSPVIWPRRRQLRAFTRVQLGPGESRMVTLTADISGLGPGTLTVFAGTDATAGLAGTIVIPSTLVPTDSV